MFGNMVKITIDFSTTLNVGYTYKVSIAELFLGPDLPLDVGCCPAMIATDGGKSAILIPRQLKPTPVFKLTCHNEDPSFCKWNKLDYKLTFVVDLPVAMLIPDEIVPDCN